MIALEEIQSTKRNCDQCNHTLESQKETNLPDFPEQDHRNSPVPL